MGERARVDAPGASDGRALEVAVVGAGAVGATAAYDLASAGASVTLYDRSRVAGGASGRAAGICYDAFAAPFDAALAGEAIERFRRLAGDDTFPFVECPYVWLAREGDEGAAEAIRDGITRMQETGVVALEMGPEDLAARFPALRTDDVAIAGVAGAAGYTDPATYTACLAAAATGAGATLETHAHVAVRSDPPRVVLADGDERDVDALVVAAGAHTAALLADAGLPIAMKPYRVQALTLGTALSEPMCYDATAEVYVRPHQDGLLAGDGTEPVAADPDDWDREADDAFVRDVAAAVAHRFPDLDLGGTGDAPPSLERAWAGLCTATPDRDPLVGERAEGLYVATGFHGHGFMRAPAIGRRLADAVLGREARLDPFDPTRFDGDEEFEIVEGLAVDPDR